MTKNNGIERYSAHELAALRAREGSRSDLRRVRARSEVELQREIAADADFRDVPKNWFETAEAMLPMAKTSLSLRLDREIVDWFKGQGPGYQRA